MANPAIQAPARPASSTAARAPATTCARVRRSRPSGSWSGFTSVMTSPPNFPPLVSPCGGYLPSDGARVGAHQLALVSPSTWKLRELLCTGTWTRPVKP